MKKLFFIISICLFHSLALANEYKSIDLIRAPETFTNIQKVKLLDSKVVLEYPESGNHENQYVVMTLGLKTTDYACNRITNVERISSQSSIQSSWNPSDSYYKVNSEYIKGCKDVGQGKPQYSKYDFKVMTYQRRISEKGKPWPKPTEGELSDRVRFFNYNSGMDHGFNRWRMYELDYRDLDNVVLTYKKHYSYVQGTVVEHRLNDR